MFGKTANRLMISCMLLLVVSACGGSGSSTAIVKNEVVLAKSAASYQEVRHIILRGTNEEIGKAIARIARENYQAQALSFPPPDDKNDYKHQRDGYILQYFPYLAARQKGVAAYFGWGAGDLHDTSALWYDMLPTACSAIFFPGIVTANGHSLQARNMDFYAANMNHFLNRPVCIEKKDDGTDNPLYDPVKCSMGNKLFSRNFVMETYPGDGGHASMVVGTFDVLNGAYDGFNERGLSISGLVDHNFIETDQNGKILKDWTVPLLTLGAQKGLSYLQLMRLILESAGTVEEVKNLVPRLTVYFPVAGIHFLIGDRNGNSTILEFERDDRKNELVPLFVDPLSYTPSIMTNHPVHIYRTINEVLAQVDRRVPYNSFYRYLRLYDYLEASHFRKYTPDDGFYAMSMVYGFADDKSEGTSRDLPLRTLWSVVMDVDDLSMKIKFYAADDDKLKTPVFSDLYTFRLQK